MERCNCLDSRITSGDSIADEANARRKIDETRFEGGKWEQPNRPSEVSYTRCLKLARANQTLGNLICHTTVATYTTSTLPKTLHNLECRSFDCKLYVRLLPSQEHDPTLSVASRAPRVEVVCAVKKIYCEITKIMPTETWNARCPHSLEEYQLRRHYINLNGKVDCDFNGKTNCLFKSSTEGWNFHQSLRELAEQLKKAAEAAAFAVSATNTDAAGRNETRELDAEDLGNIVVPKANFFPCYSPSRMLSSLNGDNLTSSKLEVSIPWPHFTRLVVPIAVVDPTPSTRQRVVGPRPVFNPYTQYQQQSREQSVYQVLPVPSSSTLLACVHLKLRFPVNRSSQVNISFRCHSLAVPDVSWPSIECIVDCMAVFCRASPRMHDHDARSPGMQKPGCYTVSQGTHVKEPNLLEFRNGSSSGLSVRLGRSLTCFLDRGKLFQTVTAGPLSDGGVTPASYRRRTTTYFDWSLFRQSGATSLESTHSVPADVWVELSVPMDARASVLNELESISQQQTSESIEPPITFSSNGATWIARVLRTALRIETTSNVCLDDFQLRPLIHELSADAKDTSTCVRSLHWTDPKTERKTILLVDEFGVPLKPADPSSTRETRSQRPSLYLADNRTSVAGFSWLHFAGSLVLAVSTTVLFLLFVSAVGLSIVLAHKRKPGCRIRRYPVHPSSKAPSDGAPSTPLVPSLLSESVCPVKYDYETPTVDTEPNSTQCGESLFLNGTDTYRSDREHPPGVPEIGAESANTTAVQLMRNWYFYRRRGNRARQKFVPRGTSPDPPPLAFQPPVSAHPFDFGRTDVALRPANYNRSSSQHLGRQSLVLTTDSNNQLVILPAFQSDSAPSTNMRSGSSITSDPQLFMIPETPPSVRRSTAVLTDAEATRLELAESVRRLEDYFSQPNQAGTPELHLRYPNCDSLTPATVARSQLTSDPPLDYNPSSESTGSCGSSTANDLSTSSDDHQVAADLFAELDNHLTNFPSPYTLGELYTCRQIVGRFWSFNAEFRLSREDDPCRGAEKQAIGSSSLLGIVYNVCIQLTMYVGQVPFVGDERVCHFVYHYCADENINTEHVNAHTFWWMHPQSFVTADQLVLMPYNPHCLKMGVEILIDLSVCIWGLQTPGVQIAANENLVNLEYADDISLIFQEEEKAQVFLDELTTAIPSSGVEMRRLRVFDNRCLTTIFSIGESVMRQLESRLSAVQRGNSVDECAQYQKLR
ncbi:hypothetical protein CLF_101896 [Clonorchis sinensis]|uniref:Uncharacterized protein n=1 Tax=Clonorchis sinensis TaxID=79923 RepID=G7Y6T7_CLOSI|nr:hypothetical protein CLF_101896 [Clonorchis sinensis]